MNFNFANQIEITKTKFLTINYVSDILFSCTMTEYKLHINILKDVPVKYNIYQTLTIVRRLVTYLGVKSMTMEP